MRKLVAALLLLTGTGTALGAACVGCGSADDSVFGSSGDGGDGGDGSFGDDGGQAFGDGATGVDAGDGSASGVLTATIRDFKLYAADAGDTVPDFENYPHINPGSGLYDPSYFGDEDDRGIVTPSLGVDGKPVYAKASGGTMTTHGRTFFDMWYRDTAGVNVRVSYPIALTPKPDGSFEYDSEKSGVPLSSADPKKNFFPIDDGTPYATSFGNQGDPHNYSFTVELHTVFTYHGGEFFSFRGDDDVFVYIDGKLVIDLGGIHGPEPAQVAVDSLGLTTGKEYPLDFFSAERHKTQSNILFTTTLGLRPAPIK